MTYKIALNFEDGVTRFIECGPNELVADASYRLGINIPMDCRDGVCGTCKCHCESGEYTLGSYLDEAMTPEEAKAGFVLTCQMKAKTDLVLKIAASSAACKAKPSSMAATLAEVRKLSPSSIGFAVKLAPGTPLSFLPGQYVNVVVPGTSETRSYSFSSMPKDGVVEFFVRYIPGGKMSEYLWSRANAGDAIAMTGPIGSFYLREIKRPVVFLAGGTGLAPFLAMLEEIRRIGSTHPIHLIFGVTNDVDLVELDKLDTFKNEIPDFTYATCVASPDSQHPLKGFVTHHLADAHLRGGDVDVYLCGPPPMVDAVRNHLSQKGVTPANFYFEKFSPSEAKS